jgi:ABC-type branched-subunit amino acid transport system ATPase component
VTPTPLLDVRGVDFAYGNAQVLYGTSVAVEPGEVLALVGPNGAGKTTLLRVIAGLERVRRGTVAFDGSDITALPTEERVRRGLGVVFAGQSIFPALSVDANLAAGGQLLDGATLEARLADVWELFPRLAERRRALGVELSGGEQQMLALAKAFLLRPRLLAIDELSLGLAPSLVGRLLDAVRRFRDDGTTILLIEQSVRVSAAVADRVALFERGQLRLVRDGAEVRAHPELLYELALSGSAQEGPRP